MRKAKMGNAFDGAGAQSYGNHGKEYRNFIAYLRKKTATCTMVCTALNIYRPNGTRFKRWAEEAGILFQVRKAPCNITGYPAFYLSTNPQLKPKRKQTSLFDGTEDVK